MKRNLTGWAETEIETTPRRAWEFVSDVTNYDRWVKGLTEPRRTSPDPFGPGSTYASKYTYGGRTHELTYEVTEYVAPQRMSVRSTSGPCPFEGTTTVEPAAAGARVRQQITFGADGAFASFLFMILGPFLRWCTKKQLRKELERLREAILRGGGKPT